MIAELKPYPEYKESGLPWLGKVPGHWETRPASGAFVPNNENNRGMKEKTVLSLSYGRIIIKPIEKLHGLVPESFETYQIVNPGYIILRTTDLQNDHTSLRVGMVRNRGIITSAYLALRVKDGVTPDFGFQFLNVWDTSKAIYEYGSGLRQNLDFSHFKRMPIPVPPPTEQAAIVKFLNHATIRLDKAILAKRKVIALLNEQKQAIIHKAVTKGLDPNVTMKDSGISWLGEIPAHWRASRLSRLATKIGDGLHGTPRYVDQSKYRFVNGNNLVQGNICFKSSTRCVSETEFEKHFIELDDSSILLSINGTIGNVAYYRGETIILGKSAAYINCGRSLYRPFLVCYFQSPSVVNFLRQEVTGTTIFNLSLGSIRKLPMVQPSFDEQVVIVSAIENRIAPVENAISRLTQEITLLREYRTRLIADIVTGKLDVREAATRLPDELEPLPDTVENVDDTAEDVVSSDEEIA
jgi:type I restriction enzyme S subunit